MSEGQLTKETEAFLQSSREENNISKFEWNGTTGKSIYVYDIKSTKRVECSRIGYSGCGK